MIDDFTQDDIRPKRGAMVDRNAEEELFKKLQKSTFIAKLDNMHLDLAVVSNGRRNKNEQFHRFNLFIKDMFDHHYSMQDMITFMDEDYFEVKIVLNCLNEENRYNLEEEMLSKYNIKKRKTKLSILVQEDDKYKTSAFL